MKDQLVRFETAKIVKEKGFDEKCFFNYDEIENVCDTDETSMDFNNSELPYKWGNYNFICSAPTQSLVQRWLREVHNIFIYCLMMSEGNVHWTNNMACREDKYYISYEESLEQGLLEGLKLIKT